MTERVPHDLDPEGKLLIYAIRDCEAAEEIAELKAAATKCAFGAPRCSGQGIRWCGPCIQRAVNLPTYRAAQRRLYKARAGMRGAYRAWKEAGGE